MNALTQAFANKRPPVSLGIVVGLHALFVWALISGIRADGVVEPPPIVLVPFYPDPTPPPPPPNDDVQIEKLDLIPDYFPPLPPIVEPNVPVPPVQEGPITPPAGQKQSFGGGSALVGPRVDPRNPLSQPPYPPSEIRAGHEGALTLALLIGPDGHVMEVKVASSSGYPVLDLAAVNEAKRRWRMLPAMRANTPVENWTKTRVVFRLDQR